MTLGLSFKLYFNNKTETVAGPKKARLKVKNRFDFFFTTNQFRGFSFNLPVARVDQKLQEFGFGWRGSLNGSPSNSVGTQWSRK